MKNNPVFGAMQLVQGFQLLLRPGLRRYLLIPLLVNTIVFTLIGWIGYTQFNLFLEHLLPESSWLHFFRWILWPLFALAFMLIVFYSFTAISNLLAAPFNSLLAARVEELVSGRKPPELEQRLLTSIIPAMLSELRKLSYFLLRAIPLLLLFLIPVVNLAAPFLWIAFSAWYLTIEYMDYPMGNHGLSFQQQFHHLRQRRWTALGFGGATTLLMMIPLLNFAAMPAAVAGATLLWCKEQKAKDSGPAAPPPPPAAEFR